MGPLHRAAGTITVAASSHDIQIVRRQPKAATVVDLGDGGVMEENC